MPFPELPDFPFKLVDQPDRILNQAATFKTNMDSRAKHIRDFFTGTGLGKQYLDSLIPTNGGISSLTFDTAANRPEPGNANAVYVATDTGVVSLDTGAAWVTVIADLSEYAKDTDLSGLAGENRTTETVKGNADAIAAHLADKTPHAELVNRIITVGVGKDFATIQGAIDSLKKQVNAGITINVDAGTYNEDVIIKGFVGGGRIVLNGADSLDNAVNYKVNSILLLSNNIRININGFDAVSTSAVAFTSGYCTAVELTYCRSTVSATAYVGISMSYTAVASVGKCLISNRKYALHVMNSAAAFSADWSAGEGNTVGLVASQGSTIGKKGTQPQGTTAEYTDSGGVIR